MLRVVYLVFNEGYSASEGATVTRHDLSSEAIRLGRLLVRLLDEPEATGLLALMLLHESRRPARTTESGDLVLLEEQDRSRWNRAQIDEGSRLVEEALRSKRYGPYTLQAAIAGVHSRAATARPTRTGARSRPVRRAGTLAPSPVVALNRAVALAMLDGPAAGLAVIDRLLAGARWPTTTWRTPPAPTSAGVWGARTTPARPTSGRWLWRDRSRNGVSCRPGWPPSEAPAAGCCCARSPSGP